MSLSPKQIMDIEDMIYFDVESAPHVAVIECNLCSWGNYVFGEVTSDANPYGFLANAFDHFKEWHPERMP